MVEMGFMRDRDRIGLDIRYVKDFGLKAHLAELLCDNCNSRSMTIENEI